MANDNNIKNFTAADIERYHKGLLSNREMHDLEKAALDDPFLADALEGYTVPGVYMVADIADLKKRLGEKVEEEKAKVIPMNGGGRKVGFPWFRAAAAVVIIAGAGLLANQFLFNKKEADIAQAKTEKNEAKINDSVSNGAETTAKAADNKGTVSPVPAGNGPVGKTELMANEDKTTAPGSTATAGGNGNNPEKITSEVTTIKAPAPVVNEPARQLDSEKADADVVTTGKVESKDLSKRDELKKQNNNAVTVADDKAKERAIQDAEYNNRNVAASRKVEEQNYRNQRNNVIRGRVTDANNVGVPFANVTNVEDRAGTYTDANGYFNFTSPDTALNVQVRSIGFENNQVQLRNSLPTNQVVLQDDRKSLTEVVISNQKPNVAALNRDANKTLQEPEPADGWANYNTYAANNLEIPEEIKTKQNNSGSVEVSFEVDKNGEPVNIRVEKSLCSKCDKEAMRLIKDGPKWKRTANKKGRTTVTISF